jgi:hypothetical protein
MIETKSTQIGQYTYQVKQLGSTPGRRMLVILGKLLGPAVAELFRGGATLATAETDALADAIESLVATVDPDVMEREILAPLEASTKFTSPELNGTWMPIASDPSHWSGRYGDMLTWLKFSLESNYTDFLSLLPMVTKVASRPVETTKTE